MAAYHIQYGMQLYSADYKEKYILTMLLENC